MEKLFLVRGLMEVYHKSNFKIKTNENVLHRRDTAGCPYSNMPSAYSERGEAHDSAQEAA